MMFFSSVKNLTALSSVVLLLLLIVEAIEHGEATATSSRGGGGGVVERWLQEPPANNVCDSAVFLTPTFTDDGTPLVVGTTINGIADTISCVGTRIPVYYQFTGTGARFKVSTCHDETDYDSALYVDPAQCGSIGCTDFKSDHDFECDSLGQAATVEFYSAKDTPYKIAVTGTADQGTGNFGLSVIEYMLPGNDQCDVAEMLELRTDMLPAVVASTANATFKSYSCEGVERISVFYKFRGTGGRILVSTCSNETDYDSALVVTDASCSSEYGTFDGCTDLKNDHDFDCQSGLGSSIEFYSLEDTWYQIAVRGVAEDDTGTFGLIGMEYVRPTNDICSMPIIVAPDEDTNTNANTIRGSTMNATKTSFSCISGEYPSVFYRIIGTGETLRVSTCSEETNFDSSIVIYEGTCDFESGEYPNGCNSDWNSDHDFDCDGHGKAATVEWETEANTIYTIAIRGVLESDKGDFGLKVTVGGGGSSTGSPGGDGNTTSEANTNTTSAAQSWFERIVPGVIMGTAAVFVGSTM